MHHLVPILTVVNGIAGLHGVVLTILIRLNRRGNQTANRFLSWVVFLISLNIVGSLYFSSSLLRTIPQVILFFQPIPLLIPPILFFYFQVQVGTGFHRRPATWFHFLPFLSVFVYLSSQIFHPAAGKRFLNDFLQPDTPAAHLFFFVYMSQAMVYLSLCLHLLVTHSRRIRDSFSNIDRIQFAWTRYLLSIFVGVAAISLLLHIVPRTTQREGTVPDGLIFSFAAAVAIFALGYRGLRHSGLFPAGSMEPTSAMDHRPKKYERTGLDETASEATRVRLDTYMKSEQPYLDPEMNLPQLAEALAVPAHHLSQVLNEKIGANFYQYINGYRLEEAKRRLNSKKTNRDKLLTIALASGFNSISTFNRVFKEFTGQTPSQFRNRPSTEK